MRFLSRAHAPACARLEVKTQADVVYLGSPETRHGEMNSSDDSSDTPSYDEATTPSSSSSSSSSSSNIPINYSIPSSSASLRGSIRFSLDSARTTFESLRVELTGTLHVPSSKASSVTGGQRTVEESYTTLRHNVDLLYDHSPSFTAGQHSLEFAIILPANIQPSINSENARLKYTLTAYAQDSHGNKSHSKAKEIQIISTGLGASSTSNDEALVDIVSYNAAVGVCRLYYMPLFAGGSGAVSSFESATRAAMWNDSNTASGRSHAEFGTITSSSSSPYPFPLRQPFSARLISDQPTVGSLLYLHLHLPSPVPGVTLYQVTVTAIQTTHINSKKHGKSTKTVERHLSRLFNLPNGAGFSEIPPVFSDVSNIKPWKIGDEVTLENMIRLPSHDVFSPSTPRHARGHPSAPLSVKVTHSICLKIRYATPQRMIKELQISRDFTLLSCKCVADTVVAPPYSVRDPRAANSKSSSGGFWSSASLSSSSSSSSSSPSSSASPKAASTSQYGYTAPGNGCACLREGNMEQISSLWKERLAGPPDSESISKIARS